MLQVTAEEKHKWYQLNGRMDELQKTEANKNW